MTVGETSDTSRRYRAGYRHAMLFQHWGARPEEVSGPVAGDDLVADATLVATRSISLDAPPADVYPWIAQMGFRKAGWYSYDWLDNLGRRSATEIHPEWQVTEGGTVPGGPIEFTAAVAQPGDAFVLAILRPRMGFTLAYDLRSEAGGTRLVTHSGRGSTCSPDDGPSG